VKGEKKTQEFFLILLNLLIAWKTTQLIQVKFKKLN